MAAPSYVVSGFVITSSIMLPIFIIGVQALHPMVASTNELMYKVFIGLTIYCMATLSWGLTRDLALGEDKDRFGYTLIGWFVVLFVILVLNNKAQLYSNMADLDQFKLM